jgi:CubicO group peptidase (beta-lactamase class C family)
MTTNSTSATHSSLFVPRPSLVLALLAAALAPAAARAQTDPFAAIPARMEQFVADGEVSGVVTLVTHNGKVVHLGAAGLANVEAKTPLTTDAMFGIMSMTKPISATALMILVDEGKVALDDPVAKYIHAFADAKLKTGEPVTGLTVRRLLTHTSGLGGKQDCHDSLEATAAELATRPFDFQPGEKWQYSPGINVCGRIIEIASGQPYEQFVTERILKPLGMNDTTYHPTADQRKRIAELYEVDEKAHTMKPAKRWTSPEDEASVANPSGGLYSTASDLAKFYHMVLAGGELDGKRILSADAVKQMTTVQYPEIPTGFTPGNGWGLGWCIVREPQGVSEALSPGTYGHGGAYGTQAWVDPAKQAVFVLLVQRSNFPNSDASDVRREFQKLAAAALEAKP